MGKIIIKQNVNKKKHCLLNDYNACNINQAGKNKSYVYCNPTDPL